MNKQEAISLMTKVLRLKHLALSTEESYIRILTQYIAFLTTISSELSSEQKIERFLTGMALKNYSASSQNVAFNALLFWYSRCLKQKLTDVNALRAKRPVLIRNAYTDDQIKLLLSKTSDTKLYPVSLIIHLLYGCGLRVSEPLNLRIRDINLSNNTFIIRQSKGNKDRIVNIPLSLIDRIKIQVEAAKAIWLRDKNNNIPIKLPNRIAQKYPAAKFSWQWAWLFPMMKPCLDPRTKTMVKYRLLECNIQRGIKEANKKIGIDIKPHELRHSYITNCANFGYNLRAIQQAVGHSSLDTTMKYIHSEPLSIKSPVDNWTK